MSSLFPLQALLGLITVAIAITLPILFILRVLAALRAITAAQQDILRTLRSIETLQKHHLDSESSRSA
jgi:preprotein translocase subunit SecF